MSEAFRDKDDRNLKFKTSTTHFIIPVHHDVPCRHWTLLVVTLGPDTATHYDSYDHEEYKRYGTITRKVLPVI